MAIDRHVIGRVREYKCRLTAIEHRLGSGIVPSIAAEQAMLSERPQVTGPGLTVVAA